MDTFHSDAQGQKFHSWELSTPEHKNTLHPCFQNKQQYNTFQLKPFGLLATGLLPFSTMAKKAVLDGEDFLALSVDLRSLLCC